MKRLVHYIAIITLVACAETASGQQTVFALLKSDVTLADRYYKSKNFSQALRLYRRAEQKNAGVGTKLKIASCYYNLKDYQNARIAYENVGDITRLPKEHLYRYAETLCVLREYNLAVSAFRALYAQAPDDYVLKKIWRIENLEYLFEDSTHIAVALLNVNSGFSEVSATPYKNGLVISSDQKVLSVVENVNGGENGTFYKLYYSELIPDSSSDVTGALKYSPLKPIGPRHKNSLHISNATYFNNNKSCVYVSSSDEAGKLQVFFAEEVSGEWTTRGSFRFNSNEFSIYDPWINEEGSELYFSSDMPGGHGGKDLYRSRWKEGEWSKPENLGDVINTPYDEAHPFLHKNVALYFSSNGHPGLGGIDVFKASFSQNSFSDPVNIGYPLNSSYDDFNIRIDSLDEGGLIISNRRAGGFDDDIYSFQMDLQNYPVAISGMAHMKENAWTDSSHVAVVPASKIKLVDNLRKLTVFETTTDVNGRFTVDVPYFSHYVIVLTDDTGEEHKAVIEIPRHRKQLSDHHVVFVRDFNSSIKPDSK